MTAYSVKLNGQNFLVEMEGTLRKLGFLTIRNVEATNPQEAENRAVAALRASDSLLNAVRNERADSPMIYADEVVEIASFDDAAPALGLAWYPEDDTQALDA